MIGQTIGQYEIEEELGKGGMGVVYRARDIKLNRLVALKFVSPLLTQDPLTRERFSREAQAAASIDHANICTVHDIAETEDGRVYIVMAYYGGETLSERIKQGPIPPAEVRRISQQIASALAAAHRAGIFHRDIKPGNIALTVEGDVKILDFGLAKLTTAGEITKSGGTIGTVAYMAPEQIRGERVDHRADLWAVGVVMYEMLTGSRPFRGEYEHALAYSIQNETPEPLATELAGENEILSSLIDRLLDKDKERRLDNAQDLAEALETGDSGETRSPVRTTSGSRTGMPTRRISMILGILAVVIAASGITYFLSSRDKSAISPTTSADERTESPIERVAVLPFSIQGSSEYQNFGDGMVSLLSTKLDGAGSWRSFDARTILAATDGPSNRLPDPEEARAYAADIGASLFVLGSMFENNGTVRINALLYSVDGQLEPIGKAEVEGPASDLFASVDRVAQQLLASEDGGPSARVSQIASKTTDSIEAFKAYLDGENAYRQSNFLLAADGFQRATDIDSTFALAWYRLAATTSWLIRSDLGKDASEKAVRFSNRLSDRDRDLLLAMRAMQHGHAEDAEERYLQHLANYPDESEAWFNLADILFHATPFNGRPPSESRDAWERVLELEPGNNHALVHLARLAFAARDETAIRDLMARMPQDELGDRAPEMIVALAIFTRDEADVAAAVSALKKADAQILVEILTMVSLWPDNESDLQLIWDETDRPTRANYAKSLINTMRSQMILMRGEYQRADSFDERIRSTDPALQHLFSVYRSLLPFRSRTPAQRDAILTDLEQWETSSISDVPSPNTFYSIHNRLYPALKEYLLGIVLVESGQYERAEELATRLHEQGSAPDEDPNVQERLAAALSGRVALAEGRTDDARFLLEVATGPEYFSKKMASPFIAGSAERFILAGLLDSIGEYNEALDIYKSFLITSVYERLYSVPALIQMAKIYEQQGQPTEALDALSQAESLWSAADPEFAPFLAEAAALKSRLESATP